MGVTTMATDGRMLAAFEVAAEQGCLVVRDTESEGDTSAWDPREHPWLVDRGSAIFAVRPATEGMVRCEVWQDAAMDALPHHVFDEGFAIGGALFVGDPSGVAAIVLPHVRGPRTVRVLVDDPEWPSEVQVVVTGGEE